MDQVLIPKINQETPDIPINLVCYSKQNTVMKFLSKFIKMGKEYAYQTIPKRRGISIEEYHRDLYIKYQITDIVVFEFTKQVTSESRKAIETGASLGITPYLVFSEEQIKNVL